MPLLCCIIYSIEFANFLILPHTSQRIIEALIIEDRWDSILIKMNKCIIKQIIKV